MTFLQLVANDLYKRCNGDLHKITVVFPGRRASVFFNQYLYQAAGNHALWEPHYLSMSELFQQLSPWQVNDPIDTVCRLYRHYCDTTGDHATSLDKFYGWGERLLADFDDIDKNLPFSSALKGGNDDDGARQLFTNIADLKQLESLDYLTDDQKETLRTFFNDFSLADKSEIRQRFLILWEQMYNIYTRLNEELKAEGLAYEGALYRHVVKEKLIQNRQGIFVFVGHNALSAVEKALLHQLQAEGRAWFYWDYDKYYLDNVFHEAGAYIRENMSEFPGLPLDDSYDNLRHIESVEFVSAPTNNAQARSVAQWLQEHKSADPTRTAIVLASEDMLLPVIHALPQGTKDVNITKGFPLGHTKVFDYVDKYFATSTEEDNSSLLNKLRSKTEEKLLESKDDILAAEAWYYTYTTLGRFLNLTESGHLGGISPTTLHKLVRYTLRQTSIPFEGEPVIGLQVMGMLETRCLDFDNVLILSANEKILPRVSADTSFIPFFLRRAFKLTTINNRTAVQSYYFYRLIQRAKHVRCVYNCSASGMSTGEMSRFMTQLMVESGLNIRHLALTAAPNIPTHLPKETPKPEDIVERLTYKGTDGEGIVSLAATVINTYLDCPLKFYYRKILNIQETNDPADVIAENTFGSLFHKVAELTYLHLSRGKTFPIKAEAIESLLKPSDPTVRTFVRQAFREMRNPVDYNGIIAEILEQYMQRTLRYDLELARKGPIVIHGLEEKYYTTLDINGTKVRVGGEIDRIDEITLHGKRTLRVVDYKTGGRRESLASDTDLSPMFTIKTSRPHYVMQTLLYCLALDGGKALPKCEGSMPITAALYYVNHPIKEPHILVKKKPLEDFAELKDNYKDGITGLLQEILSPSEPFKPNTKHCQRCAYQLLCNA